MLLFCKIVDSILVIKDLSFELGKEYENLFMVLGSESSGKATQLLYIKQLVRKKV